MRVRTTTGVISILDFVVQKNNGQKVVLEAKSSETAPLTKNQKVAFEEIRANKFYVREQGGNVAVKKISIVRPKTVDKKGVLERVITQ